MTHISFAVIAAAGILVGCSTPEFKTEQSACSVHWSKIIPVKIEKRLVTEYRREKEFTGKSVCTQNGNHTICDHDYNYVDVPYTVVKPVDINAAERNAQIAQCTQNACTLKYGNRDCKAPK